MSKEKPVKNEVHCSQMRWLIATVGEISFRVKVVTGIEVIRE